MMNPMQVAKNRSARLVAEARTPAYSTVTPAPQAREHLTMVEIDDPCGGRFWSRPIKDSEVDKYISDHLSLGYEISDVDHAASCWCFKGGN